MKRGAGAAALVLVWTLAVLPAGAGAAGPSFEQPCGGSSWVGGTTNVCSGVVTYRDYVYDDEGADRGDLGYNEGTQNAFGTLAHPAGDLRYPATTPTPRTSSSSCCRAPATRCTCAPS